METQKNDNAIQIRRMESFEKAEEIEKIVKENADEDVHNMYESMVLTESIIKKHGTIQESLTRSIEKIGDVIINLSGFKSFDEKNGKVINCLTTVVKNLQSLYQKFLTIVQCDDDQLAKKIWKDSFSHIKNLSPLTSRKDLNTRLLLICLHFLEEDLLTELIYSTSKLKESDDEDHITDRINQIKIVTAKIEACIEYLPHAAILDKNDLFSKDEHDPEVVELNKNIERRTLGEPEKVRQSYAKVLRGVYAGHVAISSSEDKKDKFLNFVTFSIGASYYFIRNSLAIKEANLFYSEPNEAIYRTWNLMEDKIIYTAIKATLPSITYCKKIYLNRYYPTVTNKLFQTSIEKNNLNKIGGEPLEPIPFTPEQMASLELPAMDNKSFTKLRIKGKDKIPLRILSVEKPDFENLQNDYDDEKKARETCFSFSMITNVFKKRVRQEVPEYDGIIFHIHGGGFVAMSSGSHQNYTRQWAKSLRKPLFSIDYRLAPQNPFPAALDDCWQAYNWILNNAKDVLGFNPSKIILAGDSAGGNLATAVALMAIKWRIRVPDGLLLVYPDQLNFTPSYLLAIHDQMIPYSLLKMCIGAYMGEGQDPRKNPFLSPLLASDELLLRLPPIRMMVGDKDPLRDDSIRFFDRMKKLKKDIKLKVYDEMPHGFLGYDLPMGMSESRECVADSIRLLHELFEL